MKQDKKIYCPAFRISVADEHEDPEQPLALLAVVEVPPIDEERDLGVAAILMAREDARSLIAILRDHFGLA